MHQRCVTVASGRMVTLGEYVAAVRIAKAQPDTTFRQGLSCAWPCTGAEIVEQFRVGMVERLNQAVPRADRGLNGPVLVPMEQPARIHRGQAQWRRRLKGRVHGFNGITGVERMTLCEHCERAYGVPEGDGYLGVLFGERRGAGWRFIRPRDCDHPAHGAPAGAEW